MKWNKTNYIRIFVEYDNSNTWEHGTKESLSTARKTLGDFISKHEGIAAIVMVAFHGGRQKHAFTKQCMPQGSAKAAQPVRALCTTAEGFAEGSKEDPIHLGNKENEVKCGNLLKLPYRTNISCSKLIAILELHVGRKASPDQPTTFSFPAHAGYALPIFLPYLCIPLFLFSAGSWFLASQADS